MNRTELQSAPYIYILIFVIAFAWIGLAYALGTESERMIVHPVVPMLLILLVSVVQGDSAVGRVRMVAIILISFWLVVRLKGVSIPFAVGISLAYVVNVAISGLQKTPIPLPKGKKLHLPRFAAVVVIVLLLIAILSFFIFAIIPQFLKQATGMKAGIVSFYNGVRGYVETLVENWQEKGQYPLKSHLPESWQVLIEDNIEKVSIYIQNKIPILAKSTSQIVAGIFSRLSAGLIGTVGQISTAFFIAIVFFYSVGSLNARLHELTNVIPSPFRDNLIRYAVEIDSNMRGFLKGQLTIIIVIMAISAIAYSILRVPFALFVGVLAGLCNAIPNVGPIIGGTIAVLSCIMGFVAGGIGAAGLLFQIVLVIGAAAGIQILDNSLISPRIMSEAVEVHPLVVVFAVLLGASLTGVWGAVLAIPGIVVFKAIMRISAQIRAERELEEMGLDMESGPSPETE